MRSRWQNGIVLACVGMLCAGGATGQVPVKPKVDTSATRIRITKEVSGGEVALPGFTPSMLTPWRVDSIARVQTATISMREDSARIIQRITDSVIWAGALREQDREAVAKLAREIAALRAAETARADSLERAEQLAIQRRMARGMYVGIAGGASMPQRAIRNGYTGGWNVTVPVGWDATSTPFGVRADFAVDHMNGTRVHDNVENTVAASGDVTVWSLNLGMKLRLHPPGAPSRTHVYALGGVGAHRVANGVYGTSGANAGADMNVADAKTKLGWNVGGGAVIGWGAGRAELFMETRFVSVKSDLPYHLAGGIGTYTSFTPVIIGVQIF